MIVGKPYKMCLVQNLPTSCATYLPFTKTFSRNVGRDPHHRSAPLAFAPNRPLNSIPFRWIHL